MAIQLI